MRSHPSLLVVLLSLAAPSALLAQARPLRAVDLGSPPGQSPMAGVLARGMAANGEFVAGVSVWEPLLWQEGVGPLALGKLPGFVNASADDVDSRGRAVGWSGLSVADYTAVVWDAAGAPRSLHRSSWRWSKALETNDAGTVLLQTATQSGFYDIPRVFLTDRAGSTLLDPAPNAARSAGRDLSASGQALLEVDGTFRIFTPGQGLAAVPSAFTDARLNDVGQLGATDGTTLQRWTAGVIEALGTAPQGNFRSVGAIDAFGRVAATEWVRTSISPPRYEKFAWIHTDGLGLQRLSTLVDTPPSVACYEVADFAGDDRIAISGAYGPDNRAILLEPRFTSVFGSACPGSHGEPRALAVGTPAGGARIVLLGAHAVRSGAAAFVISPVQASVPLPGGCTALVDAASAVLLPVATNAVGQANLPIDVPVGIAAGAVFAQLVSLDVGAANGAFALSNGVRIDLQ